MGLYPEGEWWARKRPPYPNSLFGMSDLAYRRKDGATWIRLYWDKKWRNDGRIYFEGELRQEKFELLTSDEPMDYSVFYARPQDVAWYRQNYINAMYELLESFKK